MNRKEQLVRAAEVRAQILAILRQRASKDSPLHKGQLTEIMESSGESIHVIGNMLTRLSNMELITSVKIHDGPYRLAYYIPEGMEELPIPEKKVCTSKTVPSSTSSPIDITFNEKTGRLKIVFAGLNITIGKE